VIVQVWFGAVVPAQCVHDKEAAPGTIPFQEQAPMLEHLETKGWWGLVQWNHVHRLSQCIFQNGANLQRTGKHFCSRQSSHEEHGHIDVTHGVVLSPGGGTEQVHGHNVRAVAEGSSDVFRQIGFVSHLASDCIPSPLRCQTMAQNLAGSRHHTAEWRELARIRVQIRLPRDALQQRPPAPQLSSLHLEALARSCNMGAKVMHPLL
jgi:hypothetical protein